MWRTPSGLRGGDRGKPRRARVGRPCALLCIHGAAPVAVSRPRAMPRPRTRDARRVESAHLRGSDCGALATRRPPRSVAAVAAAASSSSPRHLFRRRRRRRPRRILPRPTKRLYLVRHGRTEMNNTARHRWDDLDFVDPGLMTQTTALGMEQAASLRPVVAALDPKPEFIVASLSRALLTADLARGPRRRGGRRRRCRVTCCSPENACSTPRRRSTPTRSPTISRDGAPRDARSTRRRLVVHRDGTGRDGTGTDDGRRRCPVRGGISSGTR